MRLNSVAIVQISDLGRQNQIIASITLRRQKNDLCRIVVRGYYGFFLYTGNC